MNIEKHPSYGYLTEEEYGLMKNAAYGDAKSWMQLSKKREAAAKRKAAEVNKDKRNANIRK